MRRIGNKKDLVNTLETISTTCKTTKQDRSRKDSCVSCDCLIHVISVIRRVLLVCITRCDSCQL